MVDTIRVIFKSKCIFFAFNWVDDIYPYRSKYCCALLHILAHGQHEYESNVVLKKRSEDSGVPYLV